MRTWHGGGATHISRCPPASTGLARPGTMAATGGERGGSGPGLPPGRSAAVCPFSSLGSESARATRARGKQGRPVVGQSDGLGRLSVKHRGTRVYPQRWAGLACQNGPQAFSGPVIIGLQCFAYKPVSFCYAFD